MNHYYFATLPETARKLIFDHDAKKHARGRKTIYFFKRTTQRTTASYAKKFAVA